MVSSVAPRPRSSGFAKAYPAIMRSMPRPKATHTPSTPICQARRRFFSPKARATAGVTEYARKFMRPTTVVTSVAAMLIPASSALPSWPMRAESVSTKMGSAMSAPKAGTASARMRRFSEGSAVLAPALALGLAAVLAAFLAGAPGAVSPGSVFWCFCVLILLGYSPPPRRVPVRGAGCTLRDRCTRCALGASAA